MPVYVYSFTAREHPLRLENLRGVGDPPAALRTVTGDLLTAVVSDAAEGLRPKRRDLTAHQEVQERLMTDGPILPLQFGATAPDDDAVRAVLDDRAQEYQERLKAVAGCAEFHLKVSQDEEALLRQILQESGEARRLNDAIRDGRGTPDMSIALGELVAAEVQTRQQALAAGIVETLRPFARDESSLPPGGQDFLSISFLVEESRQEHFLTTQTGLADQLGDDYDVRLYGPLPPYSFV
jgi:hypothetical protein